MDSGDRLRNKCADIAHDARIEPFHMFELIAIHKEAAERHQPRN